MWRIHRLDDVDKHRVLLTVGSNFERVDIAPVMAPDLTDSAPDLTGSIHRYLPHGLQRGHCPRIVRAFGRPVGLGALEREDLILRRHDLVPLEHAVGEVRGRGLQVDAERARALIAGDQSLRATARALGVPHIAVSRALAGPNGWHKSHAEDVS